MKRVFSTLLVVALLLALGALAVVARPNVGGAPAAAVLAAPGARTAAAPAAPAGTTKFNMIALPLNSSSQFTYDAAGLLAYVGSSAVQVLSWDPATQAYLFRYPDGFGTNFPLVTGGAYWLELDATAPSVLSFVGDVPAQGAVTFNFVGGSPCKWNQFSIPLDRTDITNAAQLIAAIGDVEQVVSWDAATQAYLFRYADGFGENFPVKIGYPYGACLLVNKTWP